MIKNVHCVEFDEKFDEGVKVAKKESIIEEYTIDLTKHDTYLTSEVVDFIKQRYLFNPTPALYKIKKDSEIVNKVLVKDNNAIVLTDDVLHSSVDICNFLILDKMNELNYNIPFIVKPSLSQQDIVPNWFCLTKAMDAGWNPSKMSLDAPTYQINYYPGTTWYSNVINSVNKLLSVVYNNHLDNNNDDPYWVRKVIIQTDDNSALATITLFGEFSGDEQYPMFLGVGVNQTRADYIMFNELNALLTPVKPYLH